MCDCFIPAVASGTQVISNSGLHGDFQVAVASMFSDLMPKLSPAPETLPDFMATFLTFMSVHFVFVVGSGAA